MWDELLSDQAEPWFVKSLEDCEPAWSNLGSHVSAKACIEMLKKLDGNWTALHVERLQSILKLIISHATQHGMSGQHFCVWIDSSTRQLDRRALARDIARTPTKVLIGVGDLHGCMYSLDRLLSDESANATFRVQWSKAPLEETEAARDECETAKDECETAKNESETAKDERDTANDTAPAKPDAWLYLRRCKRIEFTLRCSQPFVNWVNGKTFEEVTFDWCEFNPRVNDAKHVPLQTTWRARLANLGLGTALDRAPKSLEHRFVCVDFQLDRYLGALEAAHRAWRDEQPSARAQLYQVGETRVGVLGREVPLVIYLGETAGFHAEWHAETDKDANFYLFDNTEWLDQARAFATANPVEGRKLFVAE